MARVLVAYATKHHSTGEIAEAIAAELREHALEVDCKDAGAATAAGYDAVVLGSAVYMGRWRREAVHFLAHEQERLSTLPFWVFSSGPLEERDDDSEKDEKWFEPRSVIDRAESAGVREHVVFGGRVPQNPRNFIERGMLERTPAELQDLRDWDRIRAWAASIAENLAHTTTAGSLPPG